MFDACAYSNGAQDAIKAVHRKCEALNAATGKRHEAFAAMFVAFTGFFAVATEDDAKVFELDFRNNAFLRAFVPMFERRNMRAYYKRAEGETFGILVYGPGIKEGKEDGSLADLLAHLAVTQDSPVSAVRYAPEHKEKAEEKTEEKPLPSVRDEAEKRYNGMIDGIKAAMKYASFPAKEGKELLAKLTDKKNIPGIIAAIAADVRKEREPEKDALSEALDAIAD